MSQETPQRLSFKVEIKRVLEILSNDIYDSPYALLRENIQNAYDAILMRKSVDDDPSYSPMISVTLRGSEVTIHDNGIGMDRQVISDNFWKAGSSGKNNEAARKAGVIGTFGIGAMANFGVCSTLKVTTHSYYGSTTIETYAERDSLSVTEDCIDIKSWEESREAGTTIQATLDGTQHLDEVGAINYLSPYIKYAQIPIRINDKLVSQNDYQAEFQIQSDKKYTIKVDRGNLKCKLELKIGNNGIVSISAHEVVHQNTAISGEIVLAQGRGGIYGLRNYFGLAPIPVGSSFNLGGIVNLSILHPTAGREALSRESITVTTQIINTLEQVVAEEISKESSSDSNPQFLNYIVNYRRFDLAGKIKIELKPFNELVPLEMVSSNMHDRLTLFYGGRDQQTILSFANESSCLLHLSQSNPRRTIQHQIIKQKGINEVPDRPQILKKFDRTELTLEEASLVLRISTVLSEDYLIADNQIFIAEISHQVPSVVEQNGTTVEIYLARDSQAVKQVLQAYELAHEIYNGFVKDFIRNYLYQKFSQYVPSSTRQGAEALHKILMRNKELYKYEYSDFGDIEPLLKDWVSREIDFPELIRKSSGAIRTQSQSVRINQVGNVEQEIPSITEANQSSEQNLDLLAPLPPIDRSDESTPMKILKTNQRYNHLNNFTMFLALSDRVVKKHRDFFYEPHTTKLIWGMHRIVFIFTHSSNRLSLYYDIELKERLTDDSTGGQPIPTTTILTNNRIFIPIVPELVNFFDLKEGKKEFYVRHDIVSDFSIESSSKSE